MWRDGHELLYIFHVLEMLSMYMYQVTKYSKEVVCFKSPISLSVAQAGL